MRSAIRLIKAHALGNDFLLAPAAAGAGRDLQTLARRACDRHEGIGADGLIVLDEHPDGADTLLWNADGSAAEVSGNGVRCAAAWVAHERGARPGTRLVIDTRAGRKTLTLEAIDNLRYTLRADMGPPTGLGRQLLQVAGERVPLIVLRMGNPQCVVLGPATDERLQTLGRALATHPFFPEGTNVELAAVEAPDRVRILIWERGVGPTRASGTGACAAAVAAAAFGGANRDVQVIAPGGVQHVQWTPDTVFLTGWAELIGAIDWWADLPPAAE
jgi:diaminopimelate epimerase